MRLLLFTALSGCLLGCVTHRGQITPTPPPTTGVHRVEDIAVGYAEVAYVFGMGGFGRHALFAEAQHGLIRNYPLQPHQHLENLTFSIRTFVFFPYVRQQILATADVVTREGPTGEVHYTDTYLRRIGAVTQQAAPDERAEVLLYDARRPSQVTSALVAHRDGHEAVVFAYMPRTKVFQVRSSGGLYGTRTFTGAFSRLKRVQEGDLFFRRGVPSEYQRKEVAVGDSVRWQGQSELIGEVMAMGRFEAIIRVKGQPYQSYRKVRYEAFGR